MTDLTPAARAAQEVLDATSRYPNAPSAEGLYLRALLELALAQELRAIAPRGGVIDEDRMSPLELGE